MELQNLELTDKDFDLIIEGLENIERADKMGESMTDLFIAITSKSPEERKTIEQEHLKRKRLEQEAQQFKKDRITILAGKMTLLKLYLKEQGYLKQTQH